MSPTTLPGDGDEPMERLKAERQKRARKDEAPDKDAAPDKAVADKDEKASQSAKGPLSPAQFDDDGWGDTPVQMRG